MKNYVHLDMEIVMDDLTKALALGLCAFIGTFVLIIFLMITA